MEAPNTLVMSGRLDEFGLADILQAVAFSPKCSRVELVGQDGTLHGTIWIEGGRVIAAERGGVRGPTAFYDLFRVDPTDLFVVSRVARAPVDAPLGSVASLLVDAIERAAGGSAPAEPPAGQLAHGSQIVALPAPRPGTFEGWEVPTVARPVRRGAAVLAIASARGGVGRTTVAHHLARALAHAGHRVMVVDAEGTGELAAAAGASRPVVARPIDELLSEVDAIDLALVDAAPGVRVLTVAPPPAAHRSFAAEWQALVTRARARADVVVIDAPPGLSDLAADVIAASTHVLGVVRAERRALDAIAALQAHLARGPQLGGVLVNRVEGRAPASIECLERITASGVAVFETTIPHASDLTDLGAEPPAAITWLFDALAAEVIARICPEPGQHASLR
jgi:cellulose biosynthesis protein BcsQ